jgi:hypothetical protein
MASLDSVQQKLFRVRHHFEELNHELAAYYMSNPGEMARIEEITPDRYRWAFRERIPIPARFGLICGDCLQCMRSSLDYLIWELVLAAGNVPTKSNMFPIALDRKTYAGDVKRHRLDGLSGPMMAQVDALQPYHHSDPKESPLAVLEDLSNINKHRRVILTNLHAFTIPPPYPCPHWGGIVSEDTSDGKPTEEVPFWAYVILRDGVANSMEITTCLDALARHIGEVVLPRFQEFFK